MFPPDDDPALRDPTIYNPTLDELIARSKRVQEKAADVMAQIREILEEIADRKAQEAQVNEGGIADHRSS